MGHADIRVVEKLGFAAYITKVQNEYENQRFTPERFRTVEFSKSAQKTLRRLM
jgi:hypothetical protein